MAKGEQPLTSDSGDYDYMRVIHKNVTAVAKRKCIKLGPPLDGSRVGSSQHHFKPQPHKKIVFKTLETTLGKNFLGELLIPTRHFLLRPEKNTLIESRPTTVSRGKVRHVATRAATGNITKNKYKFHKKKKTVPPVSASAG